MTMGAAYHVCIVRPPGYVHADAFLELGELITFSIEDLGHPCRLGFNTLDRHAKNIVIGTHLFGESARSRLPESAIILNTEQLGASGHAWTTGVVALSQRHEVWDYSTRNVSLLNASGAKRVRLLELGFHPRLERLTLSSNQDIDVLFYGSLGERRRTLLESIRRRGLTVKSLFEVYGAERDRWIERSKVVLNCHHYETHIFEVVRVFYLLTNRVAVVGEVGADTLIEAPFDLCIASASYETLPDRCAELCANESARRQLAESGAAVFRERRQTELLKNLL